MTVLIAFLTVSICFAISWIITVGLVKLITLCFGLGFSWLIATGIWLLLMLIKGTFKIEFKK